MARSNLTPAQLAALHWLNDPQNYYLQWKQNAAAWCLKAQHIKQSMWTRLERGGWIEQRGNGVRLTEQGRAALVESEVE